MKWNKPRLLSAIFAGIMLLPVVSAVATRIDFQNQRFATCLAQNINGEVAWGGFVIKDAFGRNAIYDPVLRTYGTELFGRRQGALMARFDTPNNLSYSLYRNEDSIMNGTWDYGRFFGLKNPFMSASYGQGEFQPSVEQYHMADTMLVCANTPWVQGTRGQYIP